MKRFAILREVPATLTWPEVDASAVQNIINMHATNVEQEVVWTQGRGLQGVRWIRSYWEPGNTWGLCLYEGESTGQVERWNFQCGVPFVEVREIEEQEPPAPVAYHAGFHADPAVSKLVVLECPAGERVEKRLAPLGVERPTWVRNYLDPERGIAISLYQAELPADETIRILESQGWAVRRVVEITPNDYMDLE
jgi:hypothetical protein